MATSSGSMGTGDEEKPTFTFEQFVLRVGVGLIIIVLLVTAVELGRVRGRVAELETEGAPAPAAATPMTRWARPSRSRSCSRRWRSSPVWSMSPPGRR
jgi:hypothetical protein